MIPVEIGKRYEAEVIGHTLEGAGVCRVENYTVFVGGAVRGERVVFEPVRVTARYAAAKLVEVLAPSPHRAEPFCPDYAACGGCALQHVDYGRHLEVLRDELAAALRRVPGVSHKDVPPILGMDDPYRYRCKAVFSAARDDLGRIRLGFLAERSHAVAPIGDCALVRPEIMEAVRAVEEEANRPGSPLGGAEGLRRATVRFGLRTGELMLMLEADAPIGESDLFERLSARLPRLSSLYGRDGGGGDRLLGGAPQIVEKILGLTFRVSPGAFFQVNPVQADALYGLVRHHAESIRPGLLLDAYCGTGSIGLALAGTAGRTLGVETNPAAIGDARENARLNGIESAEFRAGKAEEEIPALLERGLRPDLLVMDPPRRGVDGALLRAVARAAIPHVVYVSCNPFTLARDLTALCGDGYQVRSVQGVDMFAWTGHVETVVLITRVKE
jgi:23S rRNA (uracil1939-C5)-methyltransferase